VKRIVVATGGSGGHIFPALAVGTRIKKKGHEVIIAGDERITNYILGADLNYKCISCGYNLRKFKYVWNIIKGICQSVRLLKKFKAEIIIGFGGYATVPLLMAARLCGVDIYLHEQNSCIGDANRFFLRYAKLLFTSFHEIYGINISYSDRICFTGYPVREEILSLWDNFSYCYPLKGEKFNLLITGGSGGASFFGTEFMKIFTFLNATTKSFLRIVQQVRTEEELKAVEDFYRQNALEHQVKLFFDDMPEQMLKSHLVICRSGMGTASELAIIGRPVIFVPSPNVKHGHQLRNAQLFERNETCKMMEEQVFNPMSFAVELESLIYDEKRLTLLATQIRKMANVNAVEKIIQQLTMEDSL
jgi:UDP-N-acetylglucosamine--N-acetylmuramyl-(pentapeptide) pyrophosphoryl-undecaprenol N-acetylglucosamine transferase